MCLLFEKSLRRDVSYPGQLSSHLLQLMSADIPGSAPVDFDALASYGLGALVALYLLCLLIPYQVVSTKVFILFFIVILFLHRISAMQLREANPATLARALSFGL
jgi:hypothetical protein